MLQAGVYNLLITTPSITALLGTNGRKTTGVFQELMPKEVDLPVVVMKTIAATGLVVMEGPSALRSSRLELDAYARTSEQAWQVADALWDLLHGMKAVLPDGTDVDLADVLNQQDDFEDAPYSYRVLTDVMFLYRNPETSQRRP